MKIAIVGAGEVGFHLAKLLSNEAQDIYMIDINAEKLEHVNSHLDVITKKGDATSVRVLKKLEIQNFDILLAVTESQNTNLMCAILAKQLGVKKTIARIRNAELLTPNDDVDFQNLGIDFMISPQELAVNEISQLLQQSAFNDTTQFEKGALNIFGCKLDKSSPLINKTIEKSRKKYAEVDFVTIAIKRDQGTETIIPRGNTLFKSNDQVYFSVPSNSIDQMETLIGAKKIGIKDIMILGGSTIGQRASKILTKKGFRVKLIEINKQKAFELAEDLPKVLVVNGDGTDVALLESEDISGMDAFIAVTGNSETNIMTSLVAKSKGIQKTIALVENMDYINISQTIGIDTLINKKLLAASAIIKHIRKGDVIAHANLNNVDAEVLEFTVKPDSKITKNAIKNINLTTKAVFGGIIRNKKTLLPYGDFQIKAGDKVVVFCLPDAIAEVEILFD